MSDEPEEDVIHACEHCGAENVNTYPVDDNDESVGYYSTIYVCQKCLDRNPR